MKTARVRSTRNEDESHPSRTHLPPRDDSAQARDDLRATERLRPSYTTLDGAMSKIKARIGGDERTGDVRATGSASRICRRRVRVPSTGTRRQPRSIDARLKTISAGITTMSLPVVESPSPALSALAHGDVSILSRRRRHNCLAPKAATPASRPEDDDILGISRWPRRRRHPDLARRDLLPIAVRASTKRFPPSRHPSRVTDTLPRPSWTLPRPCHVFHTTDTTDGLPNELGNQDLRESPGIKTRRVLPGNVKTPSTTSSLASRVLPRRPALQLE
ncbi:hypothetical protein EV714DRAFT_278499 [Schizophyllum commune]